MEEHIETSNSIEKGLEMGFTAQNVFQANSMGMWLHEIEQQIKTFSTGFSKIILARPALLGDGIFAFSDDKFKEFFACFESEKNNYHLEKFVPASGAASRMFHFLTTFNNEFDFEKESINAYINRKKDTQLATFLVGMEKLPFYKDTIDFLEKKFPTIALWTKDLQDYYFIKRLVSVQLWNLANQPKALLPFHLIENEVFTPVEEHLLEAVSYANSNGKAHLHLTIAQEFRKEFTTLIMMVLEKMEQDYGCEIIVKFSYQAKKSDSIAVDLNNIPLKDHEDDIVFRPSGHGALIQNLNNLKSDIVFIKNIDNVSPVHFEKTVFYKKALAGMLISLQKQLFYFLQKIENQQINAENIKEVIEFATLKLCIVLNDDFENLPFENQVLLLQKLFNRPIRVCGMVKNEGEPGGGPFWTIDKRGHFSLQIVEAAQVDMDDKTQSQILQNATHFNPVDLVCGLKNYKGIRFDLNQYVDHNTGFIVQKNKNGVDLKGIELPGLWNGAMSDWISIFVETPIETFNPVKTINDLLKPAHQSK